MKQSKVTLVNDNNYIRVYAGQEQVGIFKKATIASLLDKEQDIERVESFLMFEPKPIEEGLEDEA